MTSAQPHLETGAAHSSGIQSTGKHGHVESHGHGSA